MLADATDVAANAFQPAHITIEWLDCTAALNAEPAPPRCGGELLAATLVVQLFPKKMARAIPARRSVFGYAPAGLPDQLARRAILFWDRIQDHCAAFAIDAAALLGAVLAHEIGHLLLGPGSHRSAGMMRCPRSKQDVADAVRGRLGFSAIERQLLRARVERRLRLFSEVAR